MAQNADAPQRRRGAACAEELRNVRQRMDDGETRLDTLESRLRQQDVRLQ